MFEMIIIYIIIFISLWYTIRHLYRELTKSPEQGCQTCTIHRHQLHRRKS